jgi:hypothetical protein
MRVRVRNLLASRATRYGVLLTLWVLLAGCATSEAGRPTGASPSARRARVLLAMSDGSTSSGESSGKAVQGYNVPGRNPDSQAPGNSAPRQNEWVGGRLGSRRPPEGKSASGACAQPRPGARAPAEHPSAVARARSAPRAAGVKAAEGAPAKRVGGRGAAGEPWRLRARRHAARVDEAARFPRAPRGSPLSGAAHDPVTPPGGLVDHPSRHPQVLPRTRESSWATPRTG